MKTKCNWTNVRIRTVVLIRISNFLETKKGQSLGISNPSHFLDLIIREKLENMESKK